MAEVAFSLVEPVTPEIPVAAVAPVAGGLAVIPLEPVAAETWGAQY